MNNHLIIVITGAIQSQAFVKDQEDYEQYMANQHSDFVKYARPMLEACFHRAPITKEKSPLLVVNDVKHAIYSKRSKIYYQPGRRLIPDWIVAKLPYRVVDKIMKKAQNS